MKTTTKAGLKVKTAIKAGGFGGGNHSRAGLKVRSSIKAGKIMLANHNVRALSID